jgi:hypothetical protein
MSTTVPSLAQALSLIPDFRQAQGRRYELLPVLLLSCVAVLCGCHSESAISEWAANYGCRWLRELGFKHQRGPSQSTLHRIFKGINHLLLERALTSWAESVLTWLPSKAHRTLSCLSHCLGIVVSQLAVSDKTNEITEVDALLEGLVLTGKVVTGDALLTQRTISEGIVGRGGDYLLVAKDNHPQLLDDIKMSLPTTGG